jgi:hypothetical protein
LSTMQTSRGKTTDVRGINARFTKCTPVADRGLRGHVPARPRCTTPRIGFLSIATPLRLRLPSDPASRRRPCRLPLLRLCVCLEQGLPPCTSPVMPGTHAQVQGRPRRRRGRPTATCCYARPRNSSSVMAMILSCSPIPQSEWAALLNAMMASLPFASRSVFT